MTHPNANSRPRGETTLAWLTALTSVAHFSGESYYHLRWGQPLPALFADYIANALMLIGAWRSLKVRPGSGAGMLAAAWGFAFCLSYRAVFERLEILDTNGRLPNGEPGFVIAILYGLLVLAGAIFLWSLAMA
jgi:hypothetical protein